MSKEILRAMLQDIINDRTDEADEALHQYLVAKGQQVAGLNEVVDSSLFGPAAALAAGVPAVIAGGAALAAKGADWLEKRKKQKAKEADAKKTSKEKDLEEGVDMIYYDDQLDEAIWSGKVESKWEPKEGFFKGSATAIASGLKSASKDLKQAMSRLNFYINRAGDNLSSDDKARLESAKGKLRTLYA